MHRADALRVIHIVSCRLLRRLLSEMLALDIVSSSALQSWRYDTNDTEAVTDVSTWLDEIKEGDDAEDGSP